jgi:hypothetical protein
MPPPAVCNLVIMKKPKLLLLCCLAAIAFFSCSKKDAVPTTVVITVTDGRTNSASAGAIIKLYADSAGVVNNSPKYTKTADNAGKVKFDVAYLSEYYVIVQNGSAKSFYDGFIPTGIFKSQQDINNHPIQMPPGVVGGIILKDINYDGAIDRHDKVIAPGIFIIEKNTATVDIDVY